MEVTQVNAVLNWTHVGQYRPYGDTFRECEIHTPDVLEESDILLLVKNGKSNMMILMPTLEVGILSPRLNMDINM